MRDLFKKQVLYSVLKVAAINADFHLDFGSVRICLIGKVGDSVGLEKLHQGAIFLRHYKFVLGLMRAAEASHFLPGDAGLPLGALHQARRMHVLVARDDFELH